jgi:hypothetical protein
VAGRRALDSGLMTPETGARPVALVTGVGRTVGIGAGIACQLAASGQWINAPLLYSNGGFA